MCDFCNTQGEGNLCQKELFNVDIDCGILGRGEAIGQIYKTISKIELLNLALIGGGKAMDYEIKINYCPMCGRKLEEGEN